MPPSSLESAREFLAAGRIAVVGVSRDSMKSHESFRTKMSFPFHLLSDADEAEIEKLIDSDLGTGCAYSAGSCGPKQPNGIGCFGDQGAFQMLSSPTACGNSLGATFLEVKNVCVSMGSHHIPRWGD